VALLQEGRLLREPGTPEAVAASFAAPLVRVRAAGDRAGLLAALRRVERVASAEAFGEWVHVAGADGAEPSAALAVRLRSALESAGWEDAAAESAEPSVEDVFISLMGAPAPAPAPPQTPS
jgi:hypothetical protein